MKELTLQQKNDMIDWMAQRCQKAETAKNYHYMNIRIAMDLYFGNDKTGEKYMSKLFPECHYMVFNNQSERIIYLLLVKEFINK
jgi:hypothetical protein